MAAGQQRRHKRQRAGEAQLESSPTLQLLQNPAEDGPTLLDLADLLQQIWHLQLGQLPQDDAVAPNLKQREGNH